MVNQARDSVRGSAVVMKQVGSGVSSSAEPIPISQVLQQMDFNDSVISDVADLIGTLEARLGAVLRDEMGKGETAQDTNLVPLATKLRNHGARLECCALHLKSILDRLEL